MNDCLIRKSVEEDGSKRSTEYGRGERSSLSSVEADSQVSGVLLRHGDFPAILLFQWKFFYVKRLH